MLLSIARASFALQLLTMILLCQGSSGEVYELIPLQGCAAMDFIASIKINGISYPVVVDTGSSTLIIASNACTTGCPVSPLLPISTTSGAQPSVSGSYGSGASYQAYLVTANVTLGNLTTEMSLAALSDVEGPTLFESSIYCQCGSSDAKVIGPSVGIMGMAYAGLGEDGTNSFVDNAGISMFSVLYCSTESAQLYINELPLSTNTSELVYADVQFNSNGQLDYYQVELNSIEIAGVATWQLNQQNALVDTGTTNLVLTDQLFQEVVNALVSTSEWQTLLPGLDASFFSSNECICSKNVSDWNNLLPSIRLSLPNQVNLTILPISGYLTEAPKSGLDYCFFPGLQSGDLIVLGHSLLNQYLTVFDRSTSPNRVGWLPTTALNMTYACSSQKGLPVQSGPPILANSTPQTVEQYLLHAVGVGGWLFYTLIVFGFLVVCVVLHTIFCKPKRKTAYASQTTSSRAIRK